ncbi:O-antigen ligase family protein [Flavobacteriales bacterium]|nr:O-antigen ligase family protein [Flavobacteriales bacterium]
MIFVIGIGFQIVIYKVALCALFLNWIFTTKFKKVIQSISSNSFFLAFIIFYILYALSFFWSENQSFAIADLVLKIPILILPLIMLSHEPLSIKEINKLLLAFSLSVIVLNCYCFFDALFNYLNTRNINEFFYGSLTVNMHTAYQATFTSFSIFILVYIYLNKEYSHNWIFSFLIALQFLFLFLLSSRMQMLCLSVVTPIFLIFHYYLKQKIYLGFSYTILAFVVSYFLVSTPSVLNNRYKQTVSHISSIGNDSQNSDPRKFIWKKAIDVIKYNWLFGVGVGDAKDVLVSSYSKESSKPITDHAVDSTINILKANKKYLNTQVKKLTSDHTKLKKESENILIQQINKYRFFAKKQYNFHNQYLQTFATVGFFGLIILIYLLSHLFIVSIIKKDFIVSAFLFLIAMSFLTESILERQAGVVFFTFFYLLLVMRFSLNKPA